LNLGELLTQAHMPRNTYNTHVRRAGLDFMRRPHFGTPKERYSFTHLVALECYLELFRSGMDSPLASRLITAAFEELAAVVSMTPEGLAPNGWLNVITPDAGDAAHYVVVSGEPFHLDPSAVIRCLSIGLAHVFRTVAWRKSVVEAAIAEGNPIPLGSWPADLLRHPPVGTIDTSNMIPVG